MAGQLVKRAERTWIARVYVGRDAKGKRKYHNKTVHGTKKEAQKVLNQLLLAKDAGMLVTSTAMTVDDYLDHWLEAAAKPRLRERTHKEYTDTLRRYVRPKIGAMRLTSLTPVNIQDIYSDMQQNGLSGMVRLTHTILKNALGQAVKWQMLARNPADYVDLPKRQKESKIRALTKNEVEMFLYASITSKWHVFFQLLVSTGLRPSEALALTWKDIDLGVGTLTVTKGLTWSKPQKKFVINPPKTKTSRRTIPLPPGLVGLLSQHMDNQFAKGHTDYVFTSRDGNHPHQRTIIKHAFKPALKRAGLDTTTRLYDLRHTHATLLLIAGIHPKVVSERLGHASVAITLDVYSHVLPNMQQEAADKLNDILYPEEDDNEAEHLMN